MEWCTRSDRLTILQGCFKRGKTQGVLAGEGAGGDSLQWMHEEGNLRTFGQKNQEILRSQETRTSIGTQRRHTLRAPSTCTLTPRLAPLPHLCRHQREGQQPGAQGKQAIVRAIVAALNLAGRGLQTSTQSSRLRQFLGTPDSLQGCLPTQELLLQGQQALHHTLVWVHTRQVWNPPRAPIRAPIPQATSLWCAFSPSPSDSLSLTAPPLGRCFLVHHSHALMPRGAQAWAQAHPCLCRSACARQPGRACQVELT